VKHGGQPSAASLWHQVEEQHRATAGILLKGQLQFPDDLATPPKVNPPLRKCLELGSIPTRHFFANATYFHLLLLAYNLVNWFKRLCLPPDFQAATLRTLREKILLMPAQLRRTHNRPRLALPASGPRELAWKHALHRVEHLMP
jgi:hypothetical protein